MPPDRLLVFDVRDGWAPLCRFLGREAPEGVPFPRVNESADIARAARVLDAVAYAWLPCCCALAAAAWHLASAWRR